MKIKFNVKSNTIAVYCIIVFAVCLLLSAVVFKYNVFLYYFNKIIKALSPVIWGLVIAYLLNPMVGFTEKKLNKFIFRKKKKTGAVTLYRNCRFYDSNAGYYYRYCRHYST